jgi:cytochrome P450
MDIQHYLGCSAAFALAGALIQARFSPVFSLIQIYCTSLGLFLAQVIAMLIHLAFLRPYSSPLKDIPTAPQAPLRRRLLKEPSASHFEQWMDTIPNQGLIRYFGFLNIERVLVTSPEAVRQILQEKPYEFEKQYAQKRILQRFTGKGLVVVEGAVHKMHRKVMLPAFKHQFVNGCYTIFRKKAFELVQSISDHIQLAPDEEINKKGLVQKPTSRIMDLDDFVHRAVFDIVGSVNFGYSINALSQPEGLYRKTHGYRMAFEPSPSNKVRALLAFAIPTWIVDALPIRSNRVVGKSIDEFRELGSRVIAEKKARTEYFGSGNPPSDILDLIIASGKFSDTELLDNFLTVQSAGFHTTSAALISSIWWLAQPQYIDIQRELRREIRSKISPSSAEHGMTPEVFDSMPYLRAVRDEVLRLHSSFSWFGRKPIKRIEVCGYMLPAGLSISLSPWAMQRSTALWGPDAREFKPERWLNDMSGRGGAKSTYSWLTFGAGPKTCIGEKFAKAELNCLLSSIFGRFEIEFPGTALPKVSRGVTITFKDKMTARVSVIDGW